MNLNPNSIYFQGSNVYFTLQINSDQSHEFFLKRLSNMCNLTHIKTTKSNKKIY